MKKKLSIGLLFVFILFFDILMSASNRDEKLQWWRDAKFGLFIHWGPSSISGTEISWSRIGHPFDHQGSRQVVPPGVYDTLFKQFNPVRFNANQWMELAEQAGFKYVVFITKHHDGFSMWPTRQKRFPTDSSLPEHYSIADTPFKRDICKEIADAAHNYGLKLGWYYSTRDWTHPDYLVGDNQKYNTYYEEQVRELLTDYGQVDIMWFDHVAGNWSDYTFQRLFNMMYELQSDTLLVNDRAARFIRKTEDEPPGEALSESVQGDFDTPEQK